MLVPVEEKLSDSCRAWLMALIERGPGSVNALALAADVDQSLLNKVLRGSRTATEGILIKIAPALKMAPERLLLLCLIDRVGGVQAAITFLPEVAREIERTLPPSEERLNAVRQDIATFTPRVDADERKMPDLLQKRLDNERKKREAAAQQRRPRIDQTPQPGDLRLLGGWGPDGDPDGFTEGV